MQIKSVKVGFHVRGSGESGADCGKPVTLYDSPERSWLQCECGASGLEGTIVSYGAPITGASELALGIAAGPITHAEG
jgi:hypothetical protein